MIEWIFYMLWGDYIATLDQNRNGKVKVLGWRRYRQGAYTNTFVMPWD